MTKHSLPGSPSNERLHKLKQLALLQQEPIAALKLAAYAVDAMRVLMTLGRHADMSTTFDNEIKAICPDWRNPGSIEEPTDLIYIVLIRNAILIQNLNEQMVEL